MAYTVDNLVTRVLRRLSLIVGGEVGQTEDSAVIVDLYNDRMHSLGSEGLTLTDSAGDAYTHETQEGADNFPLADNHFAGICTLVAGDAAEAFTLSITRDMSVDIRAAWDRLYGDFLVVEEMAISGGLYNLSSQRQSDG